MLRLSRLKAVFLIILISTSSAIGGVTGKIRGRITDEQTGEPLPGANVVLEGTVHGASSNLKGGYLVFNIEPGTYNLRITMIGYTPVIVLEVNVNADLTTEVDVELSQTVLDVGVEVIVTAERPLIQRDVTATQTVMHAESIANMPVNSFTELLTNTAGIVENSNSGLGAGDDGIHIRGGRSGEIAYMVDGFFVEDALYGGMGSDVASAGISELSIITGSFNAEYGEAMSGVVNIVTKEGMKHYTGSVRLSTDQWGRTFEDRMDSDFDSKRYEVSLGGPIPFLTSPLGASFYVAGDFFNTSTYLGRSQIPRTVYKEKWVDQDGDGQENAGEFFLENWVDLNGNTEYDSGEPFVDQNGNGVWDGEIASAGGYYQDLIDQGYLSPDDVNIYPLVKGDYRNNRTYLDRSRLNTKLVFRPMKSIKLVLGGVFRRQEERSFSMSFKEFPDHRRLEWNDSDLFNVTMTHTVSANTFYTLRVAKFDHRSTEGLPKILDNDHNLIKYENVNWEGDPRGDSLGTMWSYNPEPFTDVNGSSVWDDSEPYEDANNNGVWDDGESFTDINGNGAYDATGAEDYYDLNDNGRYDGGINNPLRVLYAFDGTSNYEFWGAYPEVDALGDTIRWLISDDDFYRKYSSTSWSYAGSFTSQISEAHQIKLGGELRKLSVRNFWINGLNQADASFVDFSYKPRQAEFYIQDKMEFSDMVINIGLRLDYLNPNSKYIGNPQAPLQDLTPQDAYETLPEAKVKWRLSPRLGFGYPVTDKMLFHFSYGQFFQNPEYNQLYNRTNLNEVTNPFYPFPFALNQGYIPTVGNPNLEPETTVAYEFGVQSMITSDMVASATIFYKDIYNYVTSTIYDADPTQYALFENSDYGNSRGVELTVRKRYSRSFEGSVTYTFSRAEGNASNEFTHWYEEYLASVYGLTPALKTISMPWDQPHSLTLNMDMREPGDWGINVLGVLGSGLPYTPTDARGRDMDERNSARMPATAKIDVRLTKDFHFSKMRYRLFADIQNVFDRKNVLDVFSNTGQPNASANPDASLEAQDRPHYYGTPRTIEVGLMIDFN